MTTIQKIVIAYAIIANIVGLSVMGIDKRRAICHKWRIPEKTLFLVSILGRKHWDMGRYVSVPS